MVEGGGRGPVARRFYLATEGAERRTWELSAGSCSVGSDPSNDVVVDEPTVSRFHCELVVTDRVGPRVRDLGSKNGTFIDGVRVADGFLRNGSVLRVGRTPLRFGLGTESTALPISERTAMGPLVGVSMAMRSAFAVMERAAATDATVLLEGETGTGKEGAAEAIHLASSRSGRPLTVVDCGTLAPSLLESELFGHERGAFTGAVARRLGAFEEARGGTVFIDEIGELPEDLQPKLLRVLERKEIRAVGSNDHVPVDVRVIAATNRDLRTDVNAGRFRSDLYYRLAVIRLRLPPLRERLEDLPRLVDTLLDRLGGGPDAEALRSPELMATLARCAWPGNVRELRNHLERCLAFRQPVPVDHGDELPAPPPVVSADLTLAELRRVVGDDAERRYLGLLLDACRGNVSAAAEKAKIHRVHLHRLLRRHGLRART